MENKLYKNFTCNHTEDYVYTWRYVEVDEYNRILLKTLDKGGFYFYVLNVISHINEPFEEDCEVECIFSGVAYYDGIRHLYMGDVQTNNEGYLYYPNLKLINSIMEHLEYLEEEFCNKD